MAQPRKCCCDYCMFPNKMITEEQTKKMKKCQYFKNKTTSVLYYHELCYTYMGYEEKAVKLITSIVNDEEKKLVKDYIHTLIIKDRYTPKYIYYVAYYRNKIKLNIESLRDFKYKLRSVTIQKRYKNEVKVSAKWKG